MRTHYFTHVLREREDLSRSSQRAEHQVAGPAHGCVRVHLLLLDGAGRQAAQVVDVGGKIPVITRRIW